MGVERLAERRALSADARRDKVKITAQIATCQRGIDNLIGAVEKGTLEPEEIASLLQLQRSEKARLQRELESADALVVSIDFHPTAIKRFKQNLEQISGSGGHIDAQVAASFRELIDSVVVMARKPGEPYRLETRGRLTALIGGPGGAATAAGMAKPGTKAGPIVKNSVSAKLVVPVERIELPTFGLQNRCSTAELNRHIAEIRHGRNRARDSADLAAGRIPDLPAKGQNLRGQSRPRRQEKRRPRSRLLRFRYAKALSAEMPTAVLALEPFAGLANEAVALGVAASVPAAVVIAAAVVIGVGIVAEGGCGDGAGGADRAAYDAGRGIARQEAGIVAAVVVPAVVPAIVPGVVVPVGGAVSVDTMAIGHPPLITVAGIGISRPQVLAIGVWMSATAGIVDHPLRHRGSRQRG